MTARIRAVLFDVDGTLVDTNYLHVTAWWQAFGQAGFDVPMVRIHRAIGMGSDQLLDELLPPGRDREGDDNLDTAHKALYAQYWSRLRPLPGAAALLRACKQRGYRVILASSASGRELAVLREALDAEDAIDDATSASDVGRSKPAPDLVEMSLAKSGAAAEDAVFVGDSVWDVRASQKAGLPCVAVLSGGTGRDELAEAGAAEIWAGPAELVGSLASSLLGGES